MTKYYIVKAVNEDGDSENLHGSFLRDECVYEIESEVESWKSEGYKRIRITSNETNETPDREVYGDLVTPHQLWILQAPAFNFELTETELLEKAINEGFVSLVDQENELYLINRD